MSTQINPFATLSSHLPVIDALNEAKKIYAEFRGRLCEAVKPLNSCANNFKTKVQEHPLCKRAIKTSDSIKTFVKEHPVASAVTAGVIGGTALSTLFLTGMIPVVGGIAVIMDSELAAAVAVAGVIAANTTEASLLGAFAGSCIDHARNKPGTKDKALEEKTSLWQKVDSFARNNYCAFIGGLIGGLASPASLLIGGTAATIGALGGAINSLLAFVGVIQITNAAAYSLLGGAAGYLYAKNAAPADS